MFVKLHADSCPPLQLFLETHTGQTPDNWDKREKAVVSHSYYNESRKKGNSAASERMVVIEMDAVLWLLNQRNTERRQCYIPNDMFDKQALYRWQHWVRQAPAVYTATNLGYESTTAETIDSRAIHNGKDRDKCDGGITKEESKETLAIPRRASENRTDGRDRG